MNHNTDHDARLALAYHLLTIGVHLSEIERFFSSASPPLEFRPPPEVEDQATVSTSPCEAYPEPSVAEAA